MTRSASTPDEGARSAVRKKLLSLLGEFPDSRRPIASKLIKTEDRGSHTLDTLVLDLNGGEPVPAYFSRPKKTAGKLPAVIFSHSHGGNYLLGKDEFIRGNVYLHNPPYAEALAEAGVAGLCIDHWCFGERSGKTESETFKEMLWSGRVLWGMMVYDSLRALDWLASRKGIDASRIGAAGISMGSTMSWWLAALDTRIKVCVDICCLTDFHTLVRQRGLDRHGVYYYVPGLLKHFSAADINALIAPRPHLSLNGLADLLTPPEGLDIIDKRLSAVYKEAGASGNWRLSRYNCGHMETAAMRREIFDFLAEKL
jgi:acetyl esterase/lipase